MRWQRLAVFSCTVLLAPAAQALDATTTFHGFIDTYYAWDFNRPDGQRAYTTQPVEHDAIDINLAMLGGKVETAKRRGVLTFQYGDSVDTNYAGEPNAGEGIKHLQEAYGGFKIGEELWLDAGIYLAHPGNESWISRDNWTYTRSLHSDYCPYYTTGLRLSGNSWQLHVMNGWQLIKENNSGKAVGGQYVWSLQGKTMTYNAQVGHELFPGRQASGLRTYQEGLLEIPGESIDWKGALILGTQQVPGMDKALGWGATSTQWRWRFAEGWSSALRFEYFHDHRGAINPTGTAGGFRVYGTSVNVDHALEEGALARLELRRLAATDQLYPGRRKEHSVDTFVVASLGLGF